MRYIYRHGYLLNFIEEKEVLVSDSAGIQAFTLISRYIVLFACSLGYLVALDIHIFFYKKKKKSLALIYIYILYIYIYFLRTLNTDIIFIVLKIKKVSSRCCFYSCPWTFVALLATAWMCMKNTCIYT